MTTVSAGATGTATLGATSTINITLDTSEKAYVTVTRGTTPLFGGSLVSSCTIGPYLTGDVFTITAQRGAVDYTVSTYTPAGLAGAGDMVAANNLSDVASAATSRTNLGVAIGSNVEAWDTDLDAVAALAPSNDDVLQRKAGAWTNRTVAQLAADLQGTGIGTSDIAYRYIPQNSKSAAYTTVAADSGKTVFHPTADATARTFTIDSNANVAYPVGTSISFANEDGAGAVTISIAGTDTLYFAGNGATGNRTLAAGGMATAMKITTTKWFISGVGLT